MSGPSVWLSLPSSSLFRFPPSPEPASIPPSADFTYAPAFEIPPSVYNHLLSASYPVSIALIYATTVTYANKINAQRQYKPWGFSKTKLFFTAVVAHNVFLALYSAWTFKGLLQAIRHVWPGWNSSEGLAGAIDSLCKMHGPRGLGQAVRYEANMEIWDTTSRYVKILPLGTPDATDVGRLWNEGLAFYGWLFYLSKFYEVLDTAIVLAKGKKSSILQTYHHAGAMLGVWAGIRYMSPPIWMFVFINSFIHTVMYTYFTLAALSVPVPQIVKRSLTTMQIIQIVFGASYAAAHLFISYSVPVESPYTIVSKLSAGASSATSAASSIATAAASAGVGAWVKKIGLRAVGEQGLAENIVNKDGIHPQFGQAGEITTEEIRYRTHYQEVSCIDTSGQTFAIYLNVMYLAPLTWLFVSFFFRAYTKRGKVPTDSKRVSRIESAAHDAARGLGRELNETTTPLESETAKFRKGVNGAGENVKNAAINAASKADQAVREMSRDETT
ncbi:MAG: hypothetical protein M1825_004645 [Sarcosagium campestre]|nr:MAG: hypothetical protein M1825_004645 [Sarcosagium campestre]